ncbi:MAG: hypothetical protein GXO23_00400 [Crenarchaeota archaeon]|nr:hypothetical protein [Thermoproteota archaeon]
MRPIDIEELKKSDFIIFSAMNVNGRLIGLSMIDKIITNSIDEDLRRKIAQYAESASTIVLDLSVYCPEGDEDCIRKARSMGIEPNKEVLAPLCIVAVSTRLVNMDRLLELLQKNFGDLYTALTMSYCSGNELKEALSEYFYVMSSMVAGDSDRLFRSRGFEKLESRAIVVRSDGSLEIVNID